MRRRNWQGGFTLIEVVLASALTAAALAVVSWALGLR
jgi:prepilin-type N-terminal cleavage/methylation domain-containing protein